MFDFFEVLYVWDFRAVSDFFVPNFTLLPTHIALKRFFVGTITRLLSWERKRVHF